MKTEIVKGEPCTVCGSVEKYKSSKQCLHCARAAARERRRVQYARERAEKKRGVV